MPTYEHMYQLEEEDTGRVLVRRRVKFNHPRMVEPVIMSLAVVEAPCLAMCAAWPAVAYYRDRDTDNRSNASVHSLSRKIIDNVKFLVTQMLKPVIENPDRDPNLKGELFAEAITSSPQIYHDSEGITFRWSNED